MTTTAEPAEHIATATLTLAASAAQSNATLTLAASAAQSNATPALKAPAQVPLGEARGQSNATLALSVGTPSESGTSPPATTESRQRTPRWRGCLPRRGHVGARTRPAAKTSSRSSSRGGDSGDSSDDPEPGPGSGRVFLASREEIDRWFAERHRLLMELGGWSA
jgi:hypothetical protein